MKNVFKRFNYLGLILPAILLIVWQFSAIKINNAALMPSLTAVFARLSHPFTDLLGIGSYYQHILISTTRVLLGFLISLTVAVPLGLIMGRNKTVYNVINPVIDFLRPLSPIVWIPFALIIFKTATIGDIFGMHYTRTILAHLQLSMIFVIFYGGFFPIFSSTLHGVKAVKTKYLESATLLGCNNKQAYLKVIFPHALPSIMTGLKIGLGRTWMVIVAAEMLPGSESGIGYLIMYSYELAELDILVMSMILTGVVGALLSYLLTLLSDKISFWEKGGY